MKLTKIFAIFSAVLLLAGACQQEQYGPSSFALKESLFSDLVFRYGQTRELELVRENIKVQYVKCSAGWIGEIEGDVLAITAPSQEEARSGYGEIGLYARGYDDIEWIVKFNVEVKENVKDGEPAVWQAVREGNSEASALWKSGDVIRVYDNADEAGFDFEPAVSIPSEGAAEVQFSGVVSAGSTDVYALYPAMATVSCTPEGVYSGLELASEQRAATSVPVLAVAKDAEGIMEFKNVYTYLTATFEDETIARLVVEDKDGDCALAGTYSYSYSALAPTYSQKSATLNLLPVLGSTTFAKGTYAFACMPESLSGLKITAVTKSGKKLVKEIASPVAFARNEVYDLGSFKNELTLAEKDGWELLYCNSEILENFSGQNYIGADGDSYSGSACDIIDGDYASFWSYYYLANDNTGAASVDYFPYHIVLDLGSKQDISSMKITARQPKNEFAVYSDDLWATQVACVKVEFANEITKRGMADVLDKGASVWSDAETFDSDVLKNRRVHKVDFAKTHSARYVRLTITKSYNGSTDISPSYTGASMAEFDLYNAAGSADANKISKKDWKIVYAKSERCENYGSQGMAAYDGWTGAARHMIDDNYLSMWAFNSNPTPSTAVPTVRYMPYYFVIDFGKEIDVAAFRLTNKWAKNNFADQNSFASGPGAVTIEFSNEISGRGMDDVLENGKYISSEWTLHSEAFDHTSIRKQKAMTVPLSKTVKARYCRFIINKVYRDADADGNAPTGGYGCALAEIDFLVE